MFPVEAEAARELRHVIFVPTRSHFILNSTLLLLQVFPDEAEAARVLSHFILGTELVVTLNSDDPAYFGGYLLDNYRLVQRLLDLGVPQVGVWSLCGG